MARLQKLKKQKRVRIITTIGIVCGMLMLSILSLLYFKGFDYVKDNFIGHPTKDLVDGQWVYSEYGNPGVKVETPKVLKRIDANLNHLDKNFEVLKRFEDSTSVEIENYFKAKYSEIQKRTDNIKREVETALDVKIENNPLQKLHLLDAIDKHMNEIKGKINFNGEFKKISDDLSSTKSELTDIKQKLTKAIEDNRNRSSQVVFREEKRTEKGKSKEQRKEKQTLLNRFTNLFNRNSGRKG